MQSSATQTPPGTGQSCLTDASDRVFQVPKVDSDSSVETPPSVHRQSGVSLDSSESSPSGTEASGSPATGTCDSSDGVIGAQGMESLSEQTLCLTLKCATCLALCNVRLRISASHGIVSCQLAEGMAVDTTLLPNETAEARSRAARRRTRVQKPPKRSREEAMSPPAREACRDKEQYCSSRGTPTCATYSTGKREDSPEIEEEPGDLNEMPEANAAVDMDADVEEWTNGKERVIAPNVEQPVLGSNWWMC